jgi:HlyD family secretion protein
MRRLGREWWRMHCALPLPTGERAGVRGREVETRKVTPSPGASRRPLPKGERCSKPRSRLVFVTAAFAAMLVALPSSAQPTADASRKVVAAAPGRIEGSQDAVAVGASISGIIDKVTVGQGDKVAAGQVLVRIACRDVEAQVAARIAEHEAAQAVHRKLVNGPRREDIDIAEAELKLAEARHTEAQIRVSRSARLADSNAVSQAIRDTNDRDARMAAAQFDAARHRLQLLRAGTREEELAEAQAKMHAAKHAVAVTRAELAKCDVKSPVDGVVLRKHVSEGEVISLFYPKPLVTVAETRTYRVRAEVDEHDVPRVRSGQQVEIVVNSSRQTRLRGRVTSTAPVMGRRQILTTDPADKSDRDVMEVMIDLDSRPDNLPIGLRVSVLFYE